MKSLSSICVQLRSCSVSLVLHLPSRFYSFEYSFFFVSSLVYFSIPIVKEGSNIFICSRSCFALCFPLKMRRPEPSDRQDVLYVPGLAAQMIRSPQKGTAAFRSTVPMADAHIRDAMLSMNSFRNDAASPSFGKQLARGSPDMSQSSFSAVSSPQSSPHSAFRRDTMSPGGAPAFGSPTSGRARTMLGSASFRSKTPTACAHIKALPVPVDALQVARSPVMGAKRSSTSFMSTTSKGDAHLSPVCSTNPPITGYLPRSDFDVARLPVSSASFKSSTPIAEAHIRALTKPGESLSTPHSDFDEVAKRKDQLSASFKSNTSMADAHIRALTKPVDVCTAFADA